MKKLTLLLSVMLFAWATNLWAETYTITFLTGSNSSTAMTETTEVSKVVAASSVDYIAGFTSNCKKAYHASTSGLKLGSGGNEGTLEFTLAEVCKANVTMITVKTTQYSQETPTISLYVNGGTTALSSAGPKEDIVHSFATAQEVSTIKVVSALGSATGKNTRSYLSSIIIETAAADAPTLKTLTVSGTPKKTNYEEGETFDPTGLVVTGTYSDGNPQSIAEGITWLINPDPLTAGTTTVEVIASVKNAAGKDVTSDVYEVTGLTVTAAKTLTSIAVSGTPAEFWKGDTFNHDGMTVTANWDDNSTTDVTAEAEFSAPDMTTAGVKTITVTYKDKTATYDITVKTIANTQETAYTTDQAIALIDAGKDLTSHVYVKGTISQIDNYSSGTITYWLDQNTFEVYKGKNLNNTNFTAVDDVVKGAEVIVYGQITKFGSTYELNTGNYLVSYTDPAVIKQEPTLALGTYKTSMDANEANDEYSVTYDGDGTLSVTSSNEEVATVTIKGTNIVVDALTEGTTTISVAATETDTYYFVEKKYTLTVYPAWVATSPTFEFDGGKSDINQGNGMKQNGIE
ncbi:MAG: bacterial Ig-like domain-containing protein, partial [Paludibacteraceae bacterium]